MWTEKWWHAIQARLPSGAALAPVIIAMDKTQLTQFSTSKSAYPVYLTLGNIPRAIHRKPSQHACILIGYLSRLFHESMRIILEPLKRAGIEGINVTGGDSAIRRVHPILACYVADYPEQCLVTCTKYCICPKCKRPASELSESTPGEPCTQTWTEEVIHDAKVNANSFIQFQDRCKEKEVSGGVYEPFWLNFPHCNIHLSVSPNILHQLYQGVFKHMVNWCKDLMDPKELDQRISSLPACYGVRYFKNGISALGQIRGKERKDMARIFLGCLIGKIPRSAILAYQSLLDFI
ncbi:hypothetical protein SERLA73DRAFT_53174 [Serpula lacrymans var. lacrymans S7.3]|uniref:Uncharacterized protein n=1 Tax=Serpula lacrymans var. lacrymans (strain S7.3) TaxID=936435 RepID=F8PU91_SERL3|nr:hypothetical protein SERLA73DRAFT_53174 [Serpula lacrymans var. lacrymans S7.3]